MKNRNLLLLVFLSLNLTVFAQVDWECGYNDNPPSTQSQDCANSSSTFLNEYRTPGHWIPNANTPFKTIRVNFIICRDDNGQNGWQDNSYIRNEMQAIIDTVNTFYSESIPPNYNIQCPPSGAIFEIFDTKIRFEINEIIFIDSTEFNESAGGVKANIINNYVYNNYPETHGAMNYIYTNPADSLIGFAHGGNEGVQGYYSSSNSNRPFINTYKVMRDDYPIKEEQDDPNDPPYFSYSHINHVAHEFGHALGLLHLYNVGARENLDTTRYDFLDDIYGNCDDPIMSDINDTCYNNCSGGNVTVCYFNRCFWERNDDPAPLMSSAYNWDTIRYISKKQAGRMHRALSMYDNTFSPSPNNKFMHQYVTNRYPSGTYEITQNET